VDIDKNRSFILVDTIGFVSRLPHLLIDAFKSTLEIVTEADLLIHVVDSSYENSDFQAAVTEKVLNEIGAGSKEKIKAFNKVDLIEDKGDLTLKGTGKDSFFISAKYDIGIDALMDEVKIRIFGDMVKAKLLIPYSRGDVSSYIQDKASVLNIEYNENGTLIECELKSKDYGRFREFEII
jgi:GTP-binding protein HflX